MKNLAIARRYAKALLLIGKEDGQAETYREELGGFADLLAREEQLAQAINNPLYNADGRKQVLTQVLEKLNLSPVISAFLQLLFDKGRIVFLSNISEFYDKLADELKGVVRASVVSADLLSEETAQKIRASLSKRTGTREFFGRFPLKGGPPIPHWPGQPL